MVARLSGRLLAVLLFVFAMTLAPPAHAATLTVNSAPCVITGYYAPDPTHYGTFSCTANVSGGTGSYSYSWNVFTWCCGSPYYGSGQTITGYCQWGMGRNFTVNVVDSGGASAGKLTSLSCTHP